ncbi:uncharacterized protein PHALS_00543 [Plasmopara halstedii]|uniref:Uncharacterized protein n=1 Tax=Plasmopara halstedii TaxID=4781 RepID=A0A0P1A7P6_PLAHL|nr:uncharacterized protein PHALS_00543 [Plasmopara halstedii]CEG36224.1 hypothetical protein PHALS_00543 [Plasmopara halstedii]|eukprot:XP_024572593.1 hypothetical protein PHALS_00543 [Plasmopara halstedii]
MQEHPVREWIDTLLHAAVIAKDKQSGPTRNEDEVSSTSATSHMNTVDVTVGVKTADIAISISAADSNAKDVKKEAVDKVESPKSSDAKDVIAISDIDNASSATTTKRYRRRHCEAASVWHNSATNAVLTVVSSSVVLKDVVVLCNLEVAAKRTGEGYGVSIKTARRALFRKVSVGLTVVARVALSKGALNGLSVSDFAYATGDLLVMAIRHEASHLEWSQKMRQGRCCHPQIDKAFDINSY